MNHHARVYEDFNTEAYKKAFLLVVHYLNSLDNLVLFYTRKLCKCDHDQDWSIFLIFQFTLLIWIWRTKN
jgi:hypothetical protein